MNLLKRMFGIKKPEIKGKYDGFDIEYLPHAGRYFPRYQGKYLFWWNTGQNFSLEKSISGCVYADSKDKAKKIIDKFLELRGVSTSIISVD